MTMTTPAKAASTSIALPPMPRSADETGLPFSFVCDLVLKVLYLNGGMLGRDIANHVCLPFNLMETTLKFLQDEAYVSTRGMRVASLASHESLNAGMEYQISTNGRSRAREIMEINQYAGPAPVPVAVYNAMAKQQAQVDVRIDRQTVHKAFESLVLTDYLLDHIGPAISSRQATFLYGPPGNGKTAIAELAAQLIGPPMFLPRALYVHGEVIRLFDRMHHQPVQREINAPYDTRWVLVERPVVKVGGELMPRMLELAFDPGLGFYEASLQLKANGGLFLVDDFGRQQHMPPRDLLNRLIVPLEKGVDYLNIARAGTSVDVPFTALLILSTNLHPQALMDEAFLRRVRFKVNVPNPTEEQYREIWRRTCARERIPYDDQAITYLITRYIRGEERPFHGVHPRDLLNHIVHCARYLTRPPELSKDLIDMACETYFVGADAGEQ